MLFNDDQNQAENWIKEEIWFYVLSVTGGGLTLWTAAHPINDEIVSSCCGNSIKSNYLVIWHLWKRSCSSVEQHFLENFLF